MHNEGLGHTSQTTIHPNCLAESWQNNSLRKKRTPPSPQQLGRAKLIWRKHCSTAGPILITSQKGSPALAVAASEGHSAVVKLLIERGADVNIEGVRGYALAEAACKDHPVIVQMLRDNGADINLSCGNEDYSTALEAVVAKGTACMVKILFDHGADVNLVSTSGTALQAAVWSGRARMVTLLLDYRADVNLVSCNGTVLGVAAFKGNADIVQLLLKRGADINIVGGDDGTALASAHKDIFQILLDNGADINHPGARHSPLGQAAFKGDAQQVQSLLDNGADVDLVDREFGSDSSQQQQAATTALCECSSTTGQMSTWPTVSTRPR